MASSFARPAIILNAAISFVSIKFRMELVRIFSANHMIYFPFHTQIINVVLLCFFVLIWLYPSEYEYSMGKLPKNNTQSADLYTNSTTSYSRFYFDAFLIDLGFRQQ